ncbi:SNF2 family DNA or RNA helicase [Aequitasia blattaphilus]|uniref:DEAD/DEAH box helicase n=1 Tax=Aequitasia blattaphilus TaxID=2949332 RepID=A0ABT1EE77_9FIRM|nr:DEAD/DEAH box helicase [Aequitasia blattaphilus]MCP1103146.1 DEAD/DEAH box helicase [Aequitasia blattaphilus]MCR8615786.1 DEAD/DEAH box helicase [Aequitasia blattaphilus]
MLTIREILDQVSMVTYMRGREIYNNKGVYNIRIEEDYEDETDTVSAQIQGSGRKTYYTEFIYDWVSEEIIDEFCECPAFRNYSDPCKHCVALELEYISKNGTIGSGEEETLTEQGEHPRLSTTPSMKRLLSKGLSRKINSLNLSPDIGRVELVPKLTLSQRSCEVEFTIGVPQKHMYILKNVREFASLMVSGGFHSYGKRLEMRHEMDMFRDVSKKYAEFIVDWCGRNPDEYIDYGFGGYGASVRGISLNSMELIRFLDIVENKSIHCIFSGVESRETKIVRGGYRPEVSILGGEKGIKILLESASIFAVIGEFLFLRESTIHRVDENDLKPVEEFLETMFSTPGKQAFIENKDVPAFCRELLPAIRACLNLKKINFDEEDFGIVPVEFEIYLDLPKPQVISANIKAVYEEEKYDLIGKTIDAGKRDLEKEYQAGQKIARFFNREDAFKNVLLLEDDEERMYELLTTGIDKMREIGDVYISDELKRINVSRSPKVAVGVSLSGDLLELHIATENMTTKQLVELLTKYDRKKKYYRLKDGTFLDVQDEGLQSLVELNDGLALNKSQLKDEQIFLPKYRALYLDQELKDNKGIKTNKDKAFKTLIRNMKTIEDSDFEVPKPLETILRNYQVQGYMWLKVLKSNGFGGILADEMGLGKTLQVITFLLSEFMENEGKMPNTLIVSPASLVYNWQAEIGKFAPHLPTVVVAGTAQSRKSMIQESHTGAVLITSYDLLKRDIEDYSDISFANQIIDESQYIKNHGTQAAKAVKEIKAGFKIALTGTPIENRLSELWSVFDYAMPGFLYGYTRFRDEIELPIVQGEAPEALERIRKMVSPFILRRLKRDVLKDLPDKIEENYYARLSGEQQKLYDAHVKNLQMTLGKQNEQEFKSSKIQILAELTRLRQICCHPGLIFDQYKKESVKTDLCMELLKKASEGGHKVLLFSQFTSMLELLQERLQKEKISFYTLTGSTPKKTRMELVDSFNHDDTSVFCISLKAGGTGLNLTAADIVIHYDPWWNAAVENQATDRAHRIGQKNVVTVYKLVAKDTIEEKIVKLQEKKSQLADQVLEGEGIATASFSKEELLELLQ